jgi:hypothetical protein
MPRLTPATSNETRGSKVIPIFQIYHGDALIGRSKLEYGDPPMGVAFGQFEPTDAFAYSRKAMKPTTDGVGKEQSDTRCLEDLRAETEDGTALVCAGVAVFEYGEADDLLAREVVCLGIEQPPYEELFPHHVKTHENQFKQP